MSAEGCFFCEIAADRMVAKRRYEWPEAVAIEPLNPVTFGHLLVIPKAHVPDAASEPAVTGLAFQRAAEIAQRLGAANLITSVGVSATQTVFHLHVHVVPRKEGDGLALPWASRETP